MGKFKNINVPPDGEKITVKDISYLYQIIR